MENKECLISIIVPVFNVERYIQECISSITNQTYRNLELILVNDGSTDLSGQICEENAKIDSRIIVVHKENGGAAEARNHGLEIASGDFVCFVDSDDYLISNEILEQMVADAVSNQCDITCFGMQLVYPKKVRLLVEKTAIKNNCEAIKDQLTSAIWDSACAKLFKIELIKKQRFSQLTFGEDQLFCYEALEKSNQIFYSDKIVYTYRQHESTVKKEFKNGEKILEMIQVRERIFSQAKKLYPELSKYEVAYFALPVTVLKAAIVDSKNIEQQEKELINRYFKKYFWRIMFDSLVPIKRKIHALLDLLHFSDNSLKKVMAVWRG